MKKVLVECMYKNKKNNNSSKNQSQTFVLNLVLRKVVKLFLSTNNENISKDS